jgi:hypothetical protein
LPPHKAPEVISSLPETPAFLRHLNTIRRSGTELFPQAEHSCFSAAGPRFCGLSRLHVNIPAH